LRRLVFAALLLGSAASAGALEGELGFTRESLTNNRPDWSSTYVEANHSFRPRQTLYGMMRETRRFDLTDRELMAGYYHPLAERWTGLVEASMSPEHNILPQSSILGELAFSAGGGWGAALGLRHTEYTATATNLLIGTVEKYWSSFRAAFIAYNNHPEGAGSATAHRVVFDYYYSEKSRVGAGITRGREVENVGPPIGVTTTDVRGANVYGRHWFRPDWALTWEALTHEQVELYRRRGFRLGLRHSF
jgi:YaiO family outer membrane protein